LGSEALAVWTNAPIQLTTRQPNRRGDQTAINDATVSAKRTMAEVDIVFEPVVGNFFIFHILPKCDKTAQKFENNFNKGIPDTHGKTGIPKTGML
jgi:hypothetical protein